jgi:PAS domain S-box-containing protein
MLDTGKKKRLKPINRRSKELSHPNVKLGDIFRDHSTAVMLIQIGSGRIIDINHAAEKFYGYNRTQFRKLSISDLSALSIEQYNELHSELENGKSYITCPHKLASGEIRQVEIHCSKIRSDDDDLEFAIIHDITERYKTEKMLKFRHEYETLIASISTFFIRPDHYEIDAAVNKALKSIGEFMQVDQSFIIQFSEDLSRLHLTHNWSTQIFRQKRTLLNAPSDQFPYATQKLFRGEVITVNESNNLPSVADSERKLMKQNGIKSFIIVPTISAGMVIGGIGFSHVNETRNWSEDSITLLRVIGEIITNALKRRQTEEALRDSEIKYRKFFEEDLTGDFIVSPSGQIHFCNPAFARIFGFDSVKNALHSNIDVISTKHFSIKKELKKLDRDKNIEEVEYQLRRIDGEPVHVIANLRGIYDEYDNLKEYKGYVFDITKHKRIEEQLRGAQKMEAIGRLAGGIAHDFNNILTVINGYTDLLLGSKNLKKSEQVKLKQVKRAGERAASLTGQLLAFSRKQIVKPKILNLNTVLLDIENMLQRLIGENLQIHHILDPNLDSIKIDPTQLEQVILNLAINARDAMQLGGKLFLRTENILVGKGERIQNVLIDKGNYVKFSVTDTGIGMNAEIQSHIFEPFFTTKEKGKGTGLGLSTIYGIVKQSRGYITVESAPQQGTCFNLFFPSQEEVVEEKHKKFVPESIISGTENILVVEDDEMVRELTVSFLDNFGYKVSQAANSNSALKLCKNAKNEFDLAIIDVIMPGIGGKQLAEMITDIQPQIKILFISGYTDDAIVQHGILDSSVEFLQKPFSAEILAKKIRKIFDAA